MSESPTPDTGPRRSAWREWWARLVGADGRGEERERPDDFERTYWRTADDVGDVLPQDRESDSGRPRR